MRRISSTPASNSSREKELAGATRAMRSPGASARGFSTLREPGHFRGHRLMLVASENRPQRRVGRRPRPRRAEEPLLHAAVALERVLDARERQTSAFDGVDDRLERRHLLLRLRRTHQYRVAAGGNRLDGGL